MNEDERYGERARVAGYVASGALVALAALLALLMSDSNAAMLDGILLTCAAGFIAGWCARTDPRIGGRL
jgi:hypothetical protein